MWVVSFGSPEGKSQALGVPEVTICECQVFLGDSENRDRDQPCIVKIYEAAMEMLDTVLNWKAFPLWESSLVSQGPASPKEFSIVFTQLKCI